jgi:hypothetical protein
MNMSADTANQPNKGGSERITFLFKILFLYLRVDYVLFFR